MVSSMVLCSSYGEFSVILGATLSSESRFLNVYLNAPIISFLMLSDCSTVQSDDRNLIATTFITSAVITTLIVLLVLLIVCMFYTRR